MQFFLGGLFIIVMVGLCAVSFGFGSITGTYLLFMLMDDQRFEELIQLRKKNRQ